MARQRKSPLTWSRLDSWELRAVRWCAALGQKRFIGACTRIVNTLGDGWIYLPIGIVLFFGGRSGRKVAETAVVALIVGHLVHASLKRWFVRLRPFERDTSLAPIGRVIDRYAFPSGHCMSIVCVGLPIVHQAPTLWVILLPYLLVISVCRLIAAHHYPSDVMAGLTLGTIVAVPLGAIDHLVI
jgi:undecaprenyl-diphosphatase